MANKITQYSQEIAKIAALYNNDDAIKSTCAIYESLIKSNNYRDIDSLVENFLNTISQNVESEKTKKSIFRHFKNLQLSDLGLNESYAKVKTNFTLGNDPLYKTKLAKIEALLEHKEDYANIDLVLDIYKGLPAEDVILEQIQVLEATKDKFREDIEVINMVEYLQNSTEASKYKATYKECAESLKTYLEDPNPQTRLNSLECLRKISHDSEVSTFLNYFTSLNLEDEEYSTNRDFKGSMVSTRVYDGGFMEKWITGKETAGLGQVVVEAISEANILARSVNERTVIMLLIERLSSIDSLNVDEKKLLEKLKVSYKTMDLGLADAIKELRESAVVSKTPKFKQIDEFVMSNIDAGVPDRKLVNETFNQLSQLKFDSSVASVLNNIQNNFEESKSRILVEEAIDYIDSHNTLGIHNSLKKELLEYLETNDSKKQHLIVEKYSKVTTDRNIQNFLTSWSGVQHKGIVNTNPQDFTIKDVYSIYETIDNKEHFVVNGNYIIREGQDLKIVSEDKISDNVKKYSKLLEEFRFTVTSPNSLKGYLFNDRLEIKFNSVTNEATLFINDTKFDKNSIESLKHVTESRGYGEQFNKVMDLFENIGLLTEMDFIKTIEYKKNPKIKATLFNIDETYTINFINENQGINKFSKTSRYSTLQNCLLEYMDFDISSSFVNELKIERNRIDILKADARKKYEEILESEDKLENLKETILSTPEFKEKGEKIVESFSLKLENLKKQYRKDLDIIKDLES